MVRSLLTGRLKMCKEGSGHRLINDAGAASVMVNEPVVKKACIITPAVLFICKIFYFIF